MCLRKHPGGRSRFSLWTLSASQDKRAKDKLPRWLGQPPTAKAVHRDLFFHSESATGNGFSQEVDFPQYNIPLHEEIYPQVHARDYPTFRENFYDANCLSQLLNTWISSPMQGSIKPTSHMIRLCTLRGNAEMAFCLKRINISSGREIWTYPFFPMLARKGKPACRPSEAILGRRWA